MNETENPPREGTRINVTLPRELHVALRLICIRERRTLPDVTTEALSAFVAERGQ